MMNPEIGILPIEQSNAKNQPNLKSEATQWKGRIINLVYVDEVTKATKNKLTLIIVIAAAILAVAGFIWMGVGLGAIGALVAIQKPTTELNATYENLAYKDLAGLGRYGHQKGPFFNAILEHNKGNINIQITNKTLSEFEEGGILAGFKNEPGTSERLFCGRINFKQKEIVIFPETLKTAQSHFSITLDGVPLKVDKQVISCRLGPQNDDFNHDYDIFKLNRESFKS